MVPCIEPLHYLFKKINKYFAARYKTSPYKKSQLASYVTWNEKKTVDSFLRSSAVVIWVSSNNIHNVTLQAVDTACYYTFKFV